MTVSLLAFFFCLICFAAALSSPYFSCAGATARGRKGKKKGKKKRAEAMDAFCLDPVDEMEARVRARWCAASRRVAGRAWWCADTAAVPRIPPSVLQRAIAKEWDAYAAHRDRGLLSSPLPADDVPSTGCDAAAAETLRRGAECAQHDGDRTRLMRVLVAAAVVAGAVALLAGLVVLAMRSALDRTQKDDRGPPDDDRPIDA
jgi:hypothetical protein